MITAIVSVVMFLVMVSLHEFGHFIVAKMLNFKVDEFSVGMGPAIFKKKKGETQYSIRILPLIVNLRAKMKPTIPIRELFQIKKHGKDCLCFWQAVFLISFWVLYCFLLSFRRRTTSSPLCTVPSGPVAPSSTFRPVSMSPSRCRVISDSMHRAQASLNTR